MWSASFLAVLFSAILVGQESLHHSSKYLQISLNAAEKVDPTACGHVNAGRQF